MGIPEKQSNLAEPVQSCRKEGYRKHIITDPSLTFHPTTYTMHFHGNVTKSTTKWKYFVLKCRRAMKFSLGNLSAHSCFGLRYTLLEKSNILFQDNTNYNERNKQKLNVLFFFFWLGISSSSRSPLQNILYVLHQSCTWLQMENISSGLQNTALFPVTRHRLDKSVIWVVCLFCGQFCNLQAM